ncbi:MAG: ATP synthase F1 subunit delta, partial [Actinobacteria bacterium]|nr:ATP synthase F1 subunit delta [Actinomycetota bacterium]
EDHPQVADERRPGAADPGGARGDRLLAAGGEPLIATPQRIYARALFEAAQDKGRVPVVHEQVGDLVPAIDDVPELAALLDNPETESRVKADVLERILGSADELVRNFVRLVAEKGRAGEIREIAEELDALVAAQERILDVELTTATELSEEEFGRILGRIEQASGHKVQATRSVDPDLIGGIVLQAGSMRLDASVRGRLERLRQQLSTTRS